MEQPMRIHSRPTKRIEGDKQIYKISDQSQKQTFREKIKINVLEKRLKAFDPPKRCPSFHEVVGPALTGFSC